MKQLEAVFTEVADLGEEHIANVICLKGLRDDHLACWGERITKWPLTANAEGREVVPPIGRTHYSNGGCAFDIDGDGVDELVVARSDGKVIRLLWFDEVASEEHWLEYELGSYAGGRYEAPHDMLPFTAKLPSGMETRGVVLVINRRTLAWFEIPSDPKKPWIRRDIAVLDYTTHRQSGLAVGNIAGNERLDVACGMYWAECPADPRNEPWVVRRYGTFDENGWGGMTKIAIADVDNDGICEIIASEAEIPNARLGVFKQNLADPAQLWQCSSMDTGLYAPHSVVVTDLTGNGLMDVVVGEMEAAGWSFPKNPNPKVYAYLNQGDLKFHKQLIHEGQGIHEMRSISKENRVTLYGCDEIQPQKFDDQRTNLVFWRLAGNGLMP